jgi:glycine oxidase
MANDVSRATADVAILGDGIVGLSIALELARRGVSSVVLGRRLPGAATTAAPGLLAPSVHPHPHAFSLMRASLEQYPAFARRLEQETGRRVNLELGGVIELIADDVTADPASSALPPGSSEIGGREIAALEPSLAPVSRAVLHANDGSVDPAALLAALDERTSRERLVRRIPERAIAVDLGHGVSIACESGSRVSASRLVLAAGAWSSEIEGLPRSLPVVPLRGQVLAVSGSLLRHPVVGRGGYVVPRGDTILVGSTEESVGFDPSTTGEAIRRLRSTLEALAPGAVAAPEAGRWAGLRPMTPDRLPIVGIDPAQSRLAYACGHSRNGVFLAPLTAEVIADLLTTERTGTDLSLFAPTRFDSSA